MYFLLQQWTKTVGKFCRGSSKGAAGVMLDLLLSWLSTMEEQRCFLREQRLLQEPTGREVRALASGL